MAASDSIANLTDGTTSVDIVMEKTDNRLENQLKLIHVPVLSSDQGDPTKIQSLIINLLRIKETVVINGILLDETSESAIVKKNNIRTLASKAGNLTLTWGASGANRQTLSPCDIQKWFVTEIPKRIGDEGSTNRGWKIQIELVKGTKKV